MRLFNSPFVLPLALLWLLTSGTPASTQTPSAPTLKSVAPTYTSPASGKEMYIAYCGACHGVQGRGDGPAAAALKVPPTDLTLLMQKNGGKFPESQFSYVIQHGTVAAHGSAEMPTWGQIFSTMDRYEASTLMRVKNLAQYVETLNYPIH